MVILDACRNNPFVPTACALPKASGPMRAPEGTLISYATQTGSVAQDGSDGHSPYTKALRRTIRQADSTLPNLQPGSALAVKRETAGRSSLVSSSPIDGTYFVAPAPTAAPQLQLRRTAGGLIEALRRIPDLSRSRMPRCCAS